MKTLNEIYENYKGPEGHGDKGTAHTYIDVYEELLKPYRDNGSILEIGIYLGHSLRMWREYFKTGIVAGSDITIFPSAQDLLIDDNYKIFHWDATREDFPNELGDLKFDVIVDDGSHIIQDQIKSFNLLKHKINPGGVYVIEDVNGIDQFQNDFKSLHSNCDIIDNRHIKGRFDDVLIIYKF